MYEKEMEKLKKAKELLIEVKRELDFDTLIGYAIEYVFLTIHEINNKKN